MSLPAENVSSFCVLVNVSVFLWEPVGYNINLYYWLGLYRNPTIEWSKGQMI